MITTGTIVKLKIPCLGNDVGRIGVVFNDYGTGCQVIFPNGEYDGFSTEEQATFLEEVGFDSVIGRYQFKNVMRVAEDYRVGVFDNAFQYDEKEI